MSENPILSKPKKLIEEFFQLAEEDAERIVKTLEGDMHLFKSLQPHLSAALKPVKERFDDDFRVAAVDGSCTPAPAMKVGVGVSVITAGYMISEGKEIVECDYIADSLVDRTGRRLDFKSRLKMRVLERRMAEKVLGRKVDLLIIDGSFLFPLSPEWYYSMPPESKRAVDEIYAITRRLAESGRVIGVIKRSMLQAIEAYAIFKGQLNPADARLVRDKYVLDWLMPPRSIWLYEDYTEGEDPAVLSRCLTRLIEEQSSASGDMKHILEEERERFRAVREAFGIGDIDFRRAYIRAHADTPPFEVEYPASLDVQEAAGKLLPFCNEATGLPFILDLLDHDIGVEESLMRAYIEEVHARALDRTLRRKELKSMFSPLNPEKDV